MVKLLVCVCLSVLLSSPCSALFTPRELALRFVAVFKSNPVNLITALTKGRPLLLREALTNSDPKNLQVALKHGRKELLRVALDDSRPETLRVALKDANRDLLRLGLTQARPDLLAVALRDGHPEILGAALTQANPELLGIALTESTPANLRVALTPSGWAPEGPIRPFSDPFGKNIVQSAGRFVKNLGVVLIPNKIATKIDEKKLGKTNGQKGLHVNSFFENKDKANKKNKPGFFPPSPNKNKPDFFGGKSLPNKDKDKMKRSRSGRFLRRRGRSTTLEDSYRPEYNLQDDYYNSLY